MESIHTLFFVSIQKDSHLLFIIHKNKQIMWFVHLLARCMFLFQIKTCKLREVAHTPVDSQTARMFMADACVQLGQSVDSIGLPRWHWWSRTLLSVQETEETQVPSLGQEDPPEEGIATPSGILV